MLYYVLQLEGTCVAAGLRHLWAGAEALGALLPHLPAAARAAALLPTGGRQGAFGVVFKTKSRQNVARNGSEVLNMSSKDLVSA